MNKPFLINCDMGESYGHYQIGNDGLLMPFIHAANIACGFHAGDPLQIERTIELALSHQVHIGAHPGYPDLQGFGRRVIPMSSEELSASIKYQVSAVMGLTRSKGGKVEYVKPHGALYNQMSKDADIAKIVIDAIIKVDSSLLIMGLAGSHVQDITERAGAQFIAEAFADRSYESNGKLRDRSLSGALIEDPSLAVAQVLSVLNQNRLKTHEGKEIELHAESFCIHGDNPAALDIAKALHHQLKDLTN